MAALGHVDLEVEVAQPVVAPVDLARHVERLVVLGAVNTYALDLTRRRKTLGFRRQINARIQEADRQEERSGEKTEWKVLQSKTSRLLA